MLAVRRLPRVCSRLSRVRGNASLQPASTPAESVAPPPPPTPEAAKTPAPTQQSAPSASKEQTQEQETETKGRQNLREWPSRRPHISLENPRDWNRPLAKGVLPAYDLALQYVREDSQALKDELHAVNEALRAEELKPEGKRDEAKLEALREKVKILEIQSEVNMPDVRWKTWNGLADMNKPIYRHLLEQRWREDGALDLLMERIHQMSVVPDLLPSLHPSLDLRINFPEAPSKDPHNRRTRTKHRYAKVEPGLFLLPEQTWNQPMVYTTVFHADTRLYTLVMVDLDVPAPESQSFTTFLHWLQPNIPLSALSPNPIPLSTAHTPYIPPHPQRGTPYHRYAILLLPQASPTEPISVPALSDTDRLGFDFRAFSQQYGLDGSKGGGAHMWREVWDEAVSKIHKDVLKIEEPKFGRPRKEDPYAHVKSMKKYI